MITKRGVKTGIGIVAVMIVAVALIGFKLYRDKLTVMLPDYPPIKKRRVARSGMGREATRRIPPCGPGDPDDQHSL